MLYGSSQHNPPSRFLSEVDGEHESSTPFAESMFTPQIPDQQSDSHFTPEPGAQVAVGAKVKHQLFGIGTVVDIDGDMLSIAFKSKGVKKLNAAFAPLELLS